MYIHDPSGLQHELPDQAVGDSLVDVANVDSGFLVLLPVFVFSCWLNLKNGVETYQCRAPDISIVGNEVVGSWREVSRSGATLKLEE